MRACKWVVFMRLGYFGVIFIFLNLPAIASANNLKTDNVVPDPTWQVVPTALVLPSSIRRVQLFPGKIRASHKVALSFAVSGVVEKNNAVEGKYFKKGEVIARLDQRVFKNEFEIAKANYLHLKNDLQRYKNLLAQKVITQVKYDSAKADFDIANAEMKIRAKALDDTQLKAPFDGVIAKRYVENYEHVDAKKVMVLFQDIALIKVIIQVPEQIMSDINFDEKTAFEVQIGSINHEQWHVAKRLESSTESDPATHTYEIAITVPIPTNKKLLPGMTVAVRLTLPEQNEDIPLAERVLVPVESLLLDNNGQEFVWVASKDHPLSKRRVKSVKIYGQMVEVFGEIKAGEHVAISGLRGLQENLHVRPMLVGKKGLDG